MSNRLFIGIAGGSGSGKTTLAKKLAEYFGDRLSLLRHDDYYKSQASLTLEERANLNFDHPDAFDTQLLIQHLDELRD
jgi:uridine kinase